MTAINDRHLRGLAFNAVLPALQKQGEWLPLSARRAVADAVVDVVWSEMVAPLTAAIREALKVYATHHKRHHRSAIHDPACDVCHMGLPLSRALPGKPDDRAEIQARIDALRGDGGEAP